MSRVPLIGRAYQERSEIAGAMQTVNLFEELNSDDKTAPVPSTYYYTPGTLNFATPNDVDQAKCRCTYRTSIGLAYTVIGAKVFSVQTNGLLVFVGNIADRPSQVYMADNGSALVLVDGQQGWTIDLATNSFSEIVDPSFYGADFVVFLDTFFVFNRPATNQFYISLSNVSYALLSGTAIGSGSISAAGSGGSDGVYNNVPLTGGSGTGAIAIVTVTGSAVDNVDISDPGVNYVVGDVLSAASADIGNVTGFTWTVDSNALAFDPLDIAAKSGSADPIVAILTYQKQLWLIGALTTEIWIGTGAADFYFQLVQGAYIDHGCHAPYTAANTDVIGIFLMQDRIGKNMVVQTDGYGIKDIGTPFLTNEFNSYVDSTDAIGFFFQLVDHAFYVLVFPTANKSWLYSLKSSQWYRWTFRNPNTGSLDRVRANCGMFFNGMNVVGDWENGRLYQLDVNTYTDAFTDPANPVAIPRTKTFAHMLGPDFERCMYLSFDADMQPGEQSPDIEIEPEIFLSWSDDRGRSYGNQISQSLGLGGEFQTVLSWNRLGYARDRIFKLDWSVPVKTALNGGFATVKLART